MNTRHHLFYVHGINLTLSSANGKDSPARGQRHKLVGGSTEGREEVQGEGSMWCAASQAASVQPLGGASIPPVQVDFTCES